MSEELITETKAQWGCFNGIILKKLNINQPQQIQMHRIIKIEEEDYPDQYDPAFFNHCMTTFHDQNSNQPVEAKVNINQVVSYLTQTMDLCDTPLINILNFVQSNEAFEGVDFERVRRKIMKQKYILKRNRAKNRQPCKEAVKLEFNYSLVSEEKDGEYKKQRNRMSAQISRDRKKEKVRELEEENQLLREEYDRIRLENQLIQEQLKANQKVANDPFKSVWTKFLLMLGLICLLGIIQDFLAPQPTTNLALKMQSSAQSCFSKQKQEQTPILSQDEKTKLFAKMELPLADLLGSKPKAEAVMGKLKTELKGYKVVDGLFSQKVREEIEIAKKIAFS